MLYINYLLTSLEIDDTSCQKHHKYGWQEASLAFSASRWISRLGHANTQSQGRQNNWVLLNSLKRGFHTSYY